MEDIAAHSPQSKLAIIVRQGKALDFIDGKTRRPETPEEYVRQEIAKSLEPVPGAYCAHEAWALAIASVAGTTRRTSQRGTCWRWTKQKKRASTSIWAEARARGKYGRQCRTVLLARHAAHLNRTLTSGLFSKCTVSMNRTRAGVCVITILCVRVPSPKNRTPCSRLPSVTPLAAKTMLRPGASSRVV